MFPKALCYIAIEDNKKKAIHLLKEKCKDEKRIAVKELKTKYKQHYYQDASFREYGFGATMVTIK